MTPSHLFEFQNPYCLAHFCFQLPSVRESHISVAKKLNYQAQMAHDKAVLLQQCFVSLGSLFSLALLYCENATLWSILISGQADGRLVMGACGDKRLV